LPAAQSLLGETAIGFEHEFDGLDEIRAGFLQGGRLRVGTRQLLDVADEPLGNLFKHGCELKTHVAPPPDFSLARAGLAPTIRRFG
jgi:hypothetical protein